MKNNNISAKLSTENLTFRPSKPPVTFEVTVNNDSDRIANFQLEIEAAGEKENSDYQWYRLEPEVAAAQPHGSSTEFQIFIFNTPIPGYVGTVNLTVKVFSPQLGEERRLLLRLQIERDQKPNLVSVELPVRDYQVYPGNTVDILVKLRNMGQQPASITLDFAGIDSSWLLGSQQRRLSVKPGYHQEVSFPCQPPSVAQAPSDIYPFRVEATSHNSYPASAEGNLEVLPVGFIKFSTPQSRKTLPEKNKWLPDLKSKSVSYELIFKNASNLRQEINLQVQGRDSRKCTFKKHPETVNLDLGQTAKIDLEVTTKRPWFGIRKILLLEARPELSDQRLGSTDPATQILEIKVLPIIPLWLQLLLLLLLLLALFPRETPPQHLAAVNSVRISGNGELVVSGSDDCTLRLWKIDNRKLEPDDKAIGWDKKDVKICREIHKTKGLLFDAKKIVRVVKFVPPYEKLIAVGLDNGKIKFINSLAPNNKPKLQEVDKGDRVFDLTFTNNALNMFAGYGSGKLLIWSREKDSTWQEEPKVLDLQDKQALSSFQIYALALSPDQKYLIVAGNFRRFLKIPVNKILDSKSLENFNDISLQKFENADIGGNAGRGDIVWGLDFANYDGKKILATSDSNGYIAIWDLDKCNPFSNNDQKNSQGLKEVNCQILEQWQVKSKSKQGNNNKYIAQNQIRSLKFSQDRNYLVSGGDDGRVAVWYFKDDGSFKLDEIKSEGREGKTIKAESNSKINSIDLRSISDRQGYAISGSKDSQVRLHRIE